MNKRKSSEFTKDEMTEMVNELSAPWEKLPIETDLSFRAFREFFCRCNSTDRSVVKAYNKYLESQGKMPSNRANESWYQWANTFLWLERAAAYDDFVIAETKNYTQHQQYQELIDFRRRQRDLAGKIADSATLMIEKALQALKNLDVSELTPKLIPQYIKAATTVAEMAQNAEASAMALDEIVNRMGMEGSEVYGIIDTGDAIIGVSMGDDENGDQVLIDLLNRFESDEDDEDY